MFGGVGGTEGKICVMEGEKVRTQMVRENVSFFFI
jgi:hypothetical protein